MTQVLFVCVHNSGRSQMAEAFFNALAPEGMKAVSAGTEPGAGINPAVVQAMSESGVSMQGHSPKLVTPEMSSESKRTITMGCGVKETCPLYLGLRIDDDWGLDDPAGQPIETVRLIRDEVQERVRKLISELSSGKGETRHV